MDVHTKEQRSYNMSRIKSENTKPEIIMFSELDKLNIPFEKHFLIKGKPDIAFPDKKIAVFIDGEFWHGKKFKNWKNKISQFWQKKIKDNIKRDKENNKFLKKEGWKVIHIWGRDVIKKPQKVLKKILKLF